MLVTSRGTGRWIIPKGWPMKRKAPHAAAAREALEEAGVVGEVQSSPLGSYSYEKRLKKGARYRVRGARFSVGSETAAKELAGKGRPGDTVVFAH